MPMPTATPSVVTAAIPATTRRFRLYCGFLCLAILWLPRFVCCSGNCHRERKRRVGDQPVETSTLHLDVENFGGRVHELRLHHGQLVHAVHINHASGRPALLACLSVVDAVDGLGHQLLGHVVHEVGVVGDRVVFLVGEGVQ